METCYDVRNIFLKINLYHFFVIYSTFVFTSAYCSSSNEEHIEPEAVIFPINADDVKEALLLELELDRDSKYSRLLEHNTSPSSSNTAWFGPRLGRKKRSVIDDEFLEALDESNRKNSNNIDDDTQVIRHYPLTLPLIIDGYVSKRHQMKPRLGRGGNAWPDDEERIIKAPPFSPRLGRRSFMIPMKPRLGRAGSVENAVFKPRLGRDPNIGNNEFADCSTNTKNADDKEH